MAATANFLLLSKQKAKSVNIFDTFGFLFKHMRNIISVRLYPNLVG